MTRWITIIFAIIGIALATWAVSTAKETPPSLPPVREPSINPFGRGVASLGFVEPLSRSIEISSPQPGLVERVNVEVGQVVKRGDELFKLESTSLAAEAIEARAAVEAAGAELQRLQSLPRAEDLPPLQAAVSRAKATLAERTELLQRTISVRGQNAANDWDSIRERLAVDVAAADVERAEAELLRTSAGASKEEIAVAQSRVAREQAKLSSLAMMTERQSVKAPSAGTIVRRNIEPGEYTDTTRAAMVLADLEHLAIRAQVDEEDIGLLQKAAAGKATFAISAKTRGSVVQSFPLTLVRIEPFARPKNNLSGSSSERVDTRVVDVVLAIATPPEFALLPGQAVDVYFDTGSVEKK